MWMLIFGKGSKGLHVFVMNKRREHCHFTVAEQENQYDVWLMRREKTRLGNEAIFELWS